MKPAVIQGRVVLTYEDYAEIPPDGKVHQIIEGEESVTPAPIPRHQLILVRLVEILLSHVHGHDMGEVLVAPIDLVLSRADVVQPDLLFIRKDRLAIVKEKYIDGAPDLVAEILSPTTADLDLDKKRALYEAHGVPHYWVLDPESRTVIEFHARAGRYGEPRRHGGAVFEPKVFPGFLLPLARLWA